MSYIKPMGERVLALPIEHEEKTESGIFLAGTNTMVARAKVVELPTEKYYDRGIYGDEVVLDRPLPDLIDVKKDSTIIYRKGAGIKVDDNILLDLKDILAIVED